VLALVNDRHGLRVDAVLTQADQVSTLFGYTRSNSTTATPAAA